ncbi:hypothetical protein T190611E02C_40321 [Tenacibaculum sp. 190524A05c]|uniref:hypothetical protein n=1 Tax=Tenacibaculum platacis TaxID=3137852 RepID=UPI0031FB51D5
MNIELKVKELLTEKYGFDFQAEFWTNDLINTFEEIVEATQKVIYSDKVLLVNANIEDADQLDPSYNIGGRVRKCWILEEDYDNIKHIK